MEKIKTQIRKEDSWETITLANRFMFYKIFTSYPDMCKHLLEILLHREIERIEPPNGEQTFDVDSESKSIRLDVYVKNENTAFDLEMQAVDTKELPKRARFYQDLMDVDLLKPGENYKKLKENYIIFLCLEDVFKKGMPVYRFENVCCDDFSLSLNDGTKKFFFNASEYDKMPSEEERNFFTYLVNGKAENEFTSKLNGLVEEARHNTEWRRKYMTWEQEVALSYENGVEEGIEQGIVQGREQLTKKMISAGLSLEKIMEITGLTKEQLEKLKQKTE